MNNIDFEKDQTEVLSKTENIQTLADQVQKLNTLDQELEVMDKNIKQKKKI